MKPSFTCKGCEDRYPGCHGSCKKYKREREAWEKTKAYLREDDDYVDYQNRTYNRLRRRYQR